MGSEQPVVTEKEYREALTLMAEHGDEYAGLPMPIEGEKLRIHESYKYAFIFNKEEADEDSDGIEVVNSWWSLTRQAPAYIYRINGKLTFGFGTKINHAEMQLHTMGCAVAWTIEAEAKAQRKLVDITTHHAMRSYVLTGAFLETSKRSGITYMFRKLRPTLALSTSMGDTRILCALCLHPIGYYEGTWAGAMCPTDEVIAHLMLMRGDEHDFWKQANQHPAHKPEAGLG